MKGEWIMDFIQEVLSLSSKEKKVDWFSSFMIYLFIGIFIWFVINYISPTWFIIVLFLGVGIVATLGCIIGMELGRVLFKGDPVDFETSKLYKLLKKKGYLQEFMNTINDEIESENTIKYISEISGCGLLVTETWFVFIDKRYPQVAKTTEVVKISEEIENVLVLLKDKNCLVLRNSFGYEEIEEQFKYKYPDIIVGMHIIDEEELA